MGFTQTKRARFRAGTQWVVPHELMDEPDDDGLAKVPKRKQPPGWFCANPDCAGAVEGLKFAEFWHMRHPNRRNGPVFTVLGNKEHPTQATSCYHCGVPHLSVVGAADEKRSKKADEVATGLENLASSALMAQKKVRRWNWVSFCRTERWGWVI
jgi:hypothetical protein